MASYSNIKYNSLRQAANTALNELNSNRLTDIKTNLNSSGVLPNEVKSKTNDVIEKINDSKALVGNIKTLEYNLKKLVNITNLVEDYQDKEEEIKSFRRRMDDDDSSDRRKLRRLKNELKEIGEDIDSALKKQRFW